MRRVGFLGAGLVIAVVTAACSSDENPAAPDITVGDVVGQYEATTFTLGGADLLADGASLELVLASDRSVSGELVIPASAGGPLTADMAGTFSLSDGEVSFTQAADTFVRDAVWTVEGVGVLSTQRSTSEGALIVRLSAP